MDRLFLAYAEVIRTSQWGPGERAALPQGEAPAIWEAMRLKAEELRSQFLPESSLKPGAPRQTLVPLHLSTT